MSLAYLRNAWPFRDRSPAKARAARLWLSYLLHPAPNSPKARAVAALAKTPSRATSRPSRHRRGPAAVSVPMREFAGSS
jgi:hypothetical protein